jgi:prepilin signal peptidase PulO-like enzyme (type II secretory pathway)
MAPSERLLHRLVRVNPTIAFIAALAVLLGGLFLPGIVGAALLFALGAAAIALTATTWRVQSTPTRAIRLLLLALLFAAAAAKAL